MGCDIHAHIEMYSSRECAQSPNNCWVHCFAENIGIGRDYTLFGLLANVRHFGQHNMNPKGIPSKPKLSYACANRYYLNVTDNKERHTDKCVSREQAEKYVLDGSAIYINDEKTILTNPGYHSATYLSLSEMLAVRKNYLLQSVSYRSELSSTSQDNVLEFIRSKHPDVLMQYSFPEYDSLSLYAAIKAMQALELGSDDGDITSRFVCWFDS